MSYVEIKKMRLLESLKRINTIGAISGGGVCRLALSDDDKEARDLFSSWCKAAGAEVKHDDFGNIFAIRPGFGENRKAILTGSHLDTQPHGGQLDGIYGVLAGLEVLRTLQDQNLQTYHDVVVVNWTNEEGVRFSPGLSGSSGFAGFTKKSEIYSHTSPEGECFESELERIGYKGEPIDDLNVEAYVELHIEQGPILEAESRTIGVVQGIQEVRWFEVTVDGSDRHAGTTPMHLRQDSFAATAALVSDMRAAGLELDTDIRFTVGRVEVNPGSVNTVPGRSKFSIDLRHPNAQVLDIFVSRWTAMASRIEECHGVSISIQQTMTVPSVQFARDCVAIVESAASRAGFTSMPVVSGAMHDASRLASVAPTAMIFVPSKGGISHNEAESTDDEHLAAGCQVLLGSILALAGERR